MDQVAEVTRLEKLREKYRKGRKDLLERREELEKFLSSINMIERAVRNGIVDGEILCMKLKQMYLAEGGNINDL
jgi:hypothetical protein